MPCIELEGDSTNSKLIAKYYDSHLDFPAVVIETDLGASNWVLNQFYGITVQIQRETDSNICASGRSMQVFTGTSPHQPLDASIVVCIPQLVSRRENVEYNFGSA